MPEAEKTSLPESWLELPDDKQFLLTRRCIIGRDVDSDLVIDAKSVSGSHAMLIPLQTGYVVKDLASMNGTYVNGELVKDGRPRFLADGAEIRTGEVAIRFRCLRQRPPGDEEPYKTGTQTFNQVRTRNCWLLLIDVEGFCATIEKYGDVETLAHIRDWRAQIRPMIVKNGGSISCYLGDAIFAYWPCDGSSIAQVISALRSLVEFRAGSTLAYRIAVHHGPVVFSKSDKGEELIGEDVNFIFRSEKIAKKFRTWVILSSAAAESLKWNRLCQPLGTSSVDGIEGSFAFFGLPRDISVLR